MSASGAVQIVSGSFEQNKQIEGETVSIQTDDFKDKESSKTVAQKTLILKYEKGKGFSGQLEGETVVIKMDDLQLSALKQVVAKVTQLYIQKM